jgi:hypothetical protein
MNKKAVTLVELIMAVTLSGIIVLVMACQFVAEYKMQSAIQDQTSVTTDASVAMRYIMRVMRFAIPTVNIQYLDVIGSGGLIKKILSADIEAGHLTDNPTHVEFDWMKDGTLQYTANGGVTYLLLAKNVTNFYAYPTTSMHGVANDEWVIQLTVTSPKTGMISSLETTVRPLAN